MDKSMVTVYQPTEQVAEAYRVLRTNLRFSNIDEEKKVILFTSAKPSEGKTTTISNLAVTMAKYSLKTLLIDGDLRRPRIHEQFGLKKSGGLTNYLVGKYEYDHYIQEIEDFDNLHVMTSGIEPPEPSELLFSDKMKNLLQKTREDYDIVLVDAPPILAVSDTSILSKDVDGVVMVIASNQARIDDVKLAKEQIERTGAKILGTVLTKVKESGFTDYYYR